MAVVIPPLQREDLVNEDQKKAELQKVFSILDFVALLLHWVHGILKIMPEFVEV